MIYIIFVSLTQILTMGETCDCDSCDLKSLFLGYLPDVEATYMCANKKEVTYNAGDIIIAEDQPINEFLYLKSGLVKLFRHTSIGKDQIITLCQPFDYISLLSVFSDDHYHYSVQALVPSVACVLKLDDILERCNSNAQFAMNIMKKLSKTSDEILTHTLEIRQRHLRGRIAYILLFISEHLFEGNLQYNLPISRREIAEMIGMTTENVIRILSEFRKDKILKINGKSIEILDCSRLQMINNLG